MANLHFNSLGISAISACVPRERVRNAEALCGLLSPEEIEKMIGAIGIEERRISPVGVCASDLCFAAAEKLFADNPSVSRESIDLLLFMSQTSDYRTPATAAILQERLGLSQNCAAMDLSLACSGYVYALSTAYAYASLPGIRRVLLLDGETYSKVVNPRDRVNAPLYGDAGTATLIEKSSEFGESFFVLKTDGRGENAVKIPAGGCRNPVDASSLLEQKDADGNYRRATEVVMDGMDVFNFAIRCVPEVVKELANFSGRSLAEYDSFIFHQANRVMTDFLARRLKIPSEKMLYSIRDFGNTSSASIPLTLVYALAGRVCKETLLCGFGAGFSWAAASIDLRKAKISSWIEI